jgi:hypothetical protein
MKPAFSIVSRKSGDSKKDLRGQGLLPQIVVPPLSFHLCRETDASRLDLLRSILGDEHRKSSIKPFYRFITLGFCYNFLSQLQ